MVSPTFYRLGTNIGKAALKNEIYAFELTAGFEWEKGPTGTVIANQCVLMQSADDPDLTIDWCGKRLFGAVFMLRSIALPRQARDKHTEKLRKREMRFMQGDICPWLHSLGGGEAC